MIEALRLGTRIKNKYNEIYTVTHRGSFVIEDGEIRDFNNPLFSKGLYYTITGEESKSYILLREILEELEINLDSVFYLGWYQEGISFSFAIGYPELNKPLFKSHLSLCNEEQTFLTAKILKYGLEKFVDIYYPTLRERFFL